MERESLSAVDASWSQMDERGNAADISVLWQFDQPLNLEAVAAVVHERLIQRYPRFQQRVVRHGPTLYWEDDPDFDLQHHVFERELDGRTLEEFIGELTTPNLPPDRPLWQLVLVDEGRAMVGRLHHCLGDGFGLGAALLRMTEASREGAPAVVEENVPHADHPTLREVLVHEMEEIQQHPGHTIELAAEAADLAATLGQLLLMSFDPPTVLHGKLSGQRRVAWSKSRPLAQVKEIGHEMGATINDTLLTAMTGAVRRWLELHDRPVDFDLRAMVPVNLRPAKTLEEVSDDLGNRFGLVLLGLPTSQQDPAERLRQLKENMDELKASPQAVVAFGILNAVGKAPAVVEHLVTHIFAKKASLVVTNVPGPRRQLYFAGSAIRDIVFWVPHPALFGLGMSIVSYNGSVRVGIRSDVSIVPDPAELAEIFDEELSALEQAAGSRHS